MSKIYVDEIAPKTLGGRITVPQGGIIQIQYDQFTGTTTQALLVDTYTPLNVLSVTITPTSVNSIIKLDAGLFIEFGNDDAEWDHIVFFYRDSTQLGHPTSGIRSVGVGMLPITYRVASNNSTTPNYGTFTFFDTPNTTDPITYKLGMSVGTAQTIYINHTVSDATNLENRERGTSFISATEIAG